MTCICLSIDLKYILIVSAPRSVGKAKTSQPNLLQLECLAIMLQFLGEAQTDVVPFLQLSKHE